jgi:hypothetical protein
MQIKNPKVYLTLASILVLEFSVILAWFWMTGDIDPIRFGGFPISEWLINYQGGFVRRGMLGEILFQLFPGKALIPILNQLTFFFYLAYCAIFISLLLLAKIRDRAAILIALLIPGGIFQMAIGAFFFTRKEILFLLLFGTLCLVYLYTRQLQPTKRKPWLGLFTVLAIAGGVFLTLTHEPFLFMSFPFIAVLFWVIKKENNDHLFLNKGFYLFLLAIPSVFLLCTVEHGSVLISEQIWDSLVLADRLMLSPHSPYTVYGAIGGIGWSKLQHLSTLYGVLITQGWMYWLIFIGGNYCVLAYLFARVGNTLDKAHFNQWMTLISIPLVCSLTMFFIAADWGRWIASSGNHAILLAFTLLGSGTAQSDNMKSFHIWPARLLYDKRLSHTKVIFCSILLYEFVFKLPECCIEYPHLFIQYSAFVKAFLD